MMSLQFFLQGLNVNYLMSIMKRQNIFLMPFYKDC